MTGANFSENDTYLGDGAYYHDDGYSICIYTNNGNEITNQVWAGAPAREAAHGIARRARHAQGRVVMDPHEIVEQTLDPESGIHLERPPPRKLWPGFWLRLALFLFCWSVVIYRCYGGEA